MSLSAGSRYLSSQVADEVTAAAPFWAAGVMRRIEKMAPIVRSELRMSIVY
jgi:hypothetical protein